MTFLIIPSGESYCNDRSKESAKEQRIVLRNAYAKKKEMEERELIIQKNNMKNCQSRWKLLSLIQQGKDVVIDFSFWSKENRNVYKELIQKAGAETELVYMKASKELLQKKK